MKKKHLKNPSKCSQEAKQRKLTPWHVPDHSVGMERSMQLHSQHREREMCRAEAVELISGLGTTVLAASWLCRSGESKSCRTCSINLLQTAPSKTAACTRIAAACLSLLDKADVHLWHELEPGLDS